MDRRSFNRALASAGTLLTLPPALADTAYPSKTVQVIVPFSVGGSTDIVARLIAQHLTESLGKPVVVDNRVGAGGVIGWGSVARANPDGYTLLTTETSFAIAAGLIPKLPYDARKDFTQVSIAATVPHVMVVNPAVAARSVREFIDMARAQPGKVFFGSGGTGTNTHLGGELFNSVTDARMTHVPYKGASAVLADLMSGQVQVMISSIPTALPHIRSGKLRALMVTDDKRSEALPDVPSAPEAGVPEMLMRFWIGFAAPAATPAPIVERLNREIVAVVKKPQVSKLLREQGLDPLGSSAAEATTLVTREIDRWTAVIKRAGITPQ
jgi:tripartite-type tricarboxylate transporter receptor subunit TctC